LLYRILVSVALVVLIGGFGIVCGDMFGISQTAYSTSLILIASRWALPQIFVVVCIVGFVSQQVRRKWRKPHLEAQH
jgi:hypothetical protein